MYYILLNGAPSGPFTLAQLIELWRSQRIDPLTLYWEEGNADWLPLHNIMPLLEIPERPAAANPTATLPPSLNASVPYSGTIPPSTQTEQSVWSGHPSFWHWFGSLFWSFVLLIVPAPAAVGLAIFDRHAGLFWLTVLVPVALAILILFHVFWSRNTTRYQVTNRRVSVQAGIFTRTSRELRVADIRSIGARANIFGIGNIEFSTAARDDAEVVFVSVTRVERIRDLVKQLQNEHN